MAAVSIPVNLPADLAAEARAFASESGCGFDALVTTAVSRYLKDRNDFAAMLREGHEYGRSIGITCEEDVVRVAEGEITLEQLRQKND